LAKEHLLLPTDHRTDNLDHRRSITGGQERSRSKASSLPLPPVSG
jgi:hypothetical protein